MIYVWAYVAVGIVTGIGWCFVLQKGSPLDTPTSFDKFLDNLGQIVMTIIIGTGFWPIILGIGLLHSIYKIMYDRPVERELKKWTHSA